MTKFVLFLLTYSFTKIIRVMAAATVPMAAAFLLCKVGGCRTRRLNLGVLLLVPCSCLLGYSRIYRKVLSVYKLDTGNRNRRNGGVLFWDRGAISSAAFVWAQAPAQKDCKAAAGKAGRVPGVFKRYAGDRGEKKDQGIHYRR